MRRKKQVSLQEIEHINRISVADFEIESNKADLKELEECMNRLIEKNKDFAEARRKKVLGEHMGMVGWWKY